MTDEGTRQRSHKGKICPIRFTESNAELKKPSTMTDDECGSLPVYCDGSQSISCWHLPWRHRIRILFSGCIWLGVVFGSTQPPVWIDSKRPFGA